MKKELKGHSITTYCCIECGKELSKDEYFTGFDLCKKCNRKLFGRKEYTDIWGNNKIDAILVDKVRKGV